MTARQPIRFVAVGTAGHVVNLALFAVLHESNVPHVTASVVAYLVSNALMYLANRHLTFSAESIGFWSGYLRYGLIGVIVAGLNAAILAILVNVAGLSPTVGAGLSVLLITPIAFVLIRRFAFGFADSRRDLKPSRVPA